MGGKTTLHIILAVLLIISATGKASALGISYEPLENKTLKLAAGEEYYFKLTLQNEESQDITVNVSVQSDIATLVGDPVTVLPAKTYSRFVYFNISVPADAEPGTRYAIHYSVVPTVKMEGQVPFAVRYDRSFDILVEPQAGVTVKAPPSDIDQVQRQSSKTGVVLLGAFILLVLIGVVALLWIKSKGISKKISNAAQHADVTEQHPTVAAHHAHVESAHPAQQSAAHKTPQAKTAPQEHAFRAVNGKSFRTLQELLGTNSTRSPSRAPALTPRHHRG
jgi:septal ring-binding cell division protein DamX